MNEEKKKYEISFLLKNESDRKYVNETLKKGEAEISFESELKNIPLAYKIKKESNAFFGYDEFSAEPEKISELDSLKITPILRFLVIKAEAPQKEAVFPRTRLTRTPKAAPKIAASQLSNEALEEKLKEILQ